MYADPANVLPAFHNTYDHATRSVSPVFDHSVRLRIDRPVPADTAFRNLFRQVHRLSNQSS